MDGVFTQWAILKIKKIGEKNFPKKLYKKKINEIAFSKLYWYLERPVLYGIILIQNDPMWRWRRTSGGDSSKK